MSSVETIAPRNFRELRAEIDGTWNKVKLTSRFLASFAVFSASEYFENALAVIGNKDPAIYSGEKEQRREQMVAKLGEWAVERQMVG
jgi:CO/xanthine dehydrogenase Mo-binding subunit